MTNGFIRGLNLGKMIEHLNSTINLASQILPLYSKAKPLISNAQESISKVKSFFVKPSPAPTKKRPQKKEVLSHYSNTPSFFL